MNNINLVGNLTKEVELKTTTTGKSVANLNVAVKRPFTKDLTDYYPVIAWGVTAENCKKYLVKGQKVAVTGYLTTRAYEDKNGNKKYITEVIANDVEFLEKPKAKEETTPEEILESVMATDDELPF